MLHALHPRPKGGCSPIRSCKFHYIGLRTTHLVRFLPQECRKSTGLNGSLAQTLTGEQTVLGSDSLTGVSLDGHN